VVKDDIYETFLKTDEYNAEVPSEIPPPSLYWGLGFMKDKNYGLMGHVGQFHGYDSFVAYRFKNRLAMAVSVNRTLLHDFPTLPVVKMHNDKSGNSRVFIYNAIELLKGNENPLIAKTEAEESAEPRTGTVR
jgi:hypothetical protein